jgi:hypothetical protein
MGIYYLQNPSTGEAKEQRLYPNIGYLDYHLDQGLIPVCGFNKKKVMVFHMPNIRCPSCGEGYVVGNDIGKAVVACPNCKTTVKIAPRGPYGTKYLKWDVEREFPNPREDLGDEIEELEWLEAESLYEAARCTGVQAYTASEMMCLRALESILGRLTGRNTWGDALKEMEQDYSEHVGVFRT